MDAIGDIRNTANASKGTWTISPEKTGVSASPFVGLGYDLGQSGGVEVNLILDSYKQVTLDPNFSTTPVTPSLGSRTVNTLKIEVGYTFRF